MGKIKLFILGIAGAALLTGCGAKVKVSELGAEGASVNVSEYKPIYIGNAGIPAKAAYKLAEICKDRGYSYMKITYPLDSNDKMISNAKELKECLVWSTGDQFTKGATAKCPEAKIRIRPGAAYANLGAEFYKEQPTNELVVSCNEVLAEFADYQP